MSIGALAVVEEWSDAVNRRDGHRLMHLSHQDVEVIGPRGSVRGRQVLSDWLARAGFSVEPRRWFCGGDGSGGAGCPLGGPDETGKELNRSVVASQFLVKGGAVASYRRHEEHRAALAAAGLDEGRDEVRERSTG